jgi:hypothetical protein
MAMWATKRCGTPSVPVGLAGFKLHAVAAFDVSTGRGGTVQFPSAKRSPFRRDVACRRPGRGRGRRPKNNVQRRPHRYGRGR